MTENELVQMRKKVESLKTTLAVKENECKRLSDELGEYIDLKSVSEVPEVLDRLKTDLTKLQTKSDKLHDKLNDLLKGVR